MKKIALFFVAAIFFLVACSEKSAEKKEDAKPVENSTATLTGTYTDYIDKGISIAVELGDVYDKVAENIFKPKEVPKFLNVPDMLEALRANKVDAVLISDDYIKQLIDSEIYKDFEYLLVPKNIYVNETGLIFYTTQLRDKFNEWLKTAVENGTLEEMKKRWIGVSLPKQKDIPQFELTAKNGTLKVSGSINYPPMEYLDANGKATGYQAEIVYRFAQHLGMDVEIANMTYDAVGAYIISGKADMSLSSFAITDERKQNMIFGDPISSNQIVLIVPKNTSPKNNSEKTTEKTTEDTVSYSDFIGKRFGVKNGTIYDNMSKDIMKSSNTMLFVDYPSIYEAVLKDRVDAGMRSYYAAYVSLFESEYSNLAITALPESVHNNPLGAISINQGTIDDFNRFLTKIIADGIYGKMKNRWFDSFNPKNMPAMPEIPLTKENGKIIVAISSDYMPFSFLGDNGVNLGFDIELAKRFAAYLGKDIEFVDMAFSGLLPYIMSGKADIAISDITITDERRKSVLFTEPYFTDLSAIVYKKADNSMTKADSVLQMVEKETKEGEKKENAFIAWLKTGIERNLITDNRWKMITNGLGVTMLIAIAAQFLGTIFGSFICYLLLRKNKFVNWIASRYCGLINGTPVVVLLMITYYIIFGSVDISNVLVAIAAFTLVMSAIIAQTLKGSIETVDIVEIEAARSIGFSAFKAFTTVTLPQAIRRALPSYTGSFVELVKSTAIVGYIAIQDLTRAGDIIRSRTYDAYFPLILVAVIYLIVTAICVWIFRYLIKKVNGGAVL